MRQLCYFQPCIQSSLLVRSRQAITWTFLLNTASSSTCSIFSEGGSGRITLLTKKCFCLSMDCMAVHLLSSNFLGLKGLILLEGITVVLHWIARQKPGAWSKDVLGTLNRCWAWWIKKTLRSKASTIVVSFFLKLHLGFFQNHWGFFSARVLATPGGVGLPFAGC